MTRCSKELNRSKLVVLLFHLIASSVRAMRNANPWLEKNDPPYLNTPNYQSLVSASRSNRSLGSPVGKRSDRSTSFSFSWMLLQCLASSTGSVSSSLN